MSNFMYFIKNKVFLLLRFIKFSIKKIFYYFGWKLEKIYIQKQSNSTPPNIKEIEILINCSGILHLGAHRGSEAPIYDWLGKKVIWVEANPRIYFDLKINTKKYINQKCFNHLITDRVGLKYEFNISNNDSASSSIFKFGKLSVGKDNLWPEKKPLKYSDKIELTSTTVDYFISNNNINIEEYNHWVVDLQGAELLALNGSVNSIKNCKSILIEVSDGEVYKNSPNYREILQFLDFYNFKPCNTMEGKHCNLLLIKN